MGDNAAVSSRAQTRIRRGETAAGGWELIEADPAPSLRGLVRGYAGFVERSAVPLVRREVPSGTPVLVFNFGAPLEVGAPGRPTVAHRGAFLARVSALPARTAFVGVSAGVQVDLTPLGLRLFCDTAMDELPDPSVGVADLLGAEGALLEEALACASGWAARFELLDAALERRFAAARPPVPSVAWAWRQLRASDGRAEIGTIAAAIGCSRRHLIAGFREQIGVSPKTAARILRFDRSARRLRGGDPTGLSLLAAECGYHDQAHMTRDFRALAGTTPAAYRAALLGDYLGVAGEGDAAGAER